MHKLQSLICLKSSLTYISTAKRRRRGKKTHEDFSQIGKELKFRILGFAVHTLLTEQNETFRELFNEVLFLIVKEGEREYLALLHDFSNKVIAESFQSVGQVVAALHKKEAVYQRLQM